MTEMPGEEPAQQPSRRPLHRRWLFRVFRAALLLYVLVLLMLLLLENQIIFPAPRFPVGDWDAAGLNHEDVYFTSADGTQLHGWYLAHDRPRAHLLFCHGNAENVAFLADLLASYRDDYQVCIFAFDYRGYGRSEGSPQEVGVLADGQAAHQWLARKAGIPTDQIVVIGRSLGAAVAVDLATSLGARGLVLERAFTKLPDVAARHYPLLPVRWLMKTQLDSTAKIQQYRGPLLQSHGTSDAIVPFDLGRELFDLAASDQKTFFVEQNADHNDPYLPEYLRQLGKFLEELP